MSWNYRVLRRTHKNEDETVEVSYAIHTVFYDKDGKPNGCSVNGSPFTWDEGENPMNELHKFVRALALPVLNYEDFKR